jgi:hypothetical protein
MIHRFNDFLSEIRREDMPKRKLLPSVEGRYRLRELLKEFDRCQGTLNESLAQELVGLLKNPRNSAGMTEAEIGNLSRTVDVIRAQFKL